MCAVRTAIARYRFYLIFEKKRKSFFFWCISDKLTPPLNLIVSLHLPISRSEPSRVQKCSRLIVFQKTFAMKWKKRKHILLAYKLNPFLETLALYRSLQ